MMPPVPPKIASTVIGLPFHFDRPLTALSLTIVTATGVAISGGGAAFGSSGAPSLPTISRQSPRFTSAPSLPNFLGWPTPPTTSPSFLYCLPSSCSTVKYAQSSPCIAAHEYFLPSTFVGLPSLDTR